MDDYLNDVSTLVTQLAQLPVLIGWSMGGLVAMMAAERGLAQAWVGLEPSQPASKSDPGITLRDGEFGPEEYGVTDAASVARIAPGLDHDERACVMASLCKESRRARDERKAGIVVKRLPCPSLVIADPARTDFRDRYRAVRQGGSRLGIEFFDVSTTSHWDLVLNRRFLAHAVPQVVTWLGERL
jgi:pimeloyl-ACP methyl ester carboxylesterase